MTDIQTNKFYREAVLTEILDVFTIIGKHKGIVYGSFVRNVLVPRECDPTCEVTDYGQLDLWFMDGADADNFRIEMGDQLKLFTIHCGTFEQSHDLVIHDTPICRILMKMGLRLPECFCDIDRLVYFPGDDTFSIVHPNGQLFPENRWTGFNGKLMERIMEKEARLTLTTVNLLTQQSEPDEAKRLNRFQFDYVNRDWKLMLPASMGKTVCPGEIILAGRFREWVIDNYKSPKESLTSSTASSDAPDPLAIFEQHLVAVRDMFIQALDD